MGTQTLKLLSSINNTTEAMFLQRERSTGFLSLPQREFVVVNILNIAAFNHFSRRIPFSSTSRTGAMFKFSEYSLVLINHYYPSLSYDI